MGLKQKLKKGKRTKNIYKFLYHWKYDGFKNAYVIFADDMRDDTKSNQIKQNVVKMNGLSMDSYCLPEILLRNEQAKKKVSIYVCANTIYAPEKGHSGGPGTVVATQQQVFGESYAGIPCNYVFEKKPTRPAHLTRALSEMPISNRFIIAAYAIEYGLDIWKDLDRFNEYIFICHDVGTAYGAYLRKCRYIVVYHQQGALVPERVSNGDPMNERDIEVANAVEEVVFNNADQVYFPSLGARETFKATTTMDYSNVKFADYALYNTIPDSELKPEEEECLIADFKLSEEERKTTDVFLSIGDFSHHKAMERIPDFLREYYDKTGRKIYWIAIGRKLKTGIFEQLVEESVGYPFKVKLLGDRVSHDTILGLMNYSDYYIMLHRYSIFDLSTLEAMRAGTGIILSNINGNTEYNQNNNVVLVDVENYSEAVDELRKRSKHLFAELNQKTFEQFFSKKNFHQRYARMIDEEMKRIGCVRKSAENWQ